MMAQYPPAVWANAAAAKDERRLTRAILSCAATHELATLNTFQRLASEPKCLNFYGSSHMNA